MVIFRKARRRKPGIYAYRTRKHLRRGTEWGYAGMSTSLPNRYRCHAGTCHHQGCIEKPWYDLKTAYFELRLPWWLGWKWFLLTLETIVIFIARPRYNDQKNPRRSKVRPREQKVQRAIRDVRRMRGLPDARRGRFVDALVIGTSTALMLAGLFGWLFTR
jgi:hypothetical protein